MRPLLGYRLRATNVTMAFFLNSLYLAVVAVLTFVIHDYMRHMDYFDISKKMDASQRIYRNLRLYGIMLLFTFLVGFFAYVLLFVLFGFGGGLLAVSKSPLIDKRGRPSWLTHIFYRERERKKHGLPIHTKTKTKNKKHK